MNELNNPQMSGSTAPGSARPVSPGLPGARRLGDVKDLAGLLHVSQKTIRRLTDAGKIPGAIRIGRLLRFDLVLINSWIAAGCPRKGVTIAHRHST